MQVVLTAGSGKSTVIAHTCAALLRSGYSRRPLYLTSTTVLVHQMVAVLRELNIGDDEPLGDTHYVQTLQSGLELSDADGVITVATTEGFRSFASEEAYLKYDLIILDDVSYGVDSRHSRTAEWVGRFPAAVILFASKQGPESFGETVFAYGLREALNDGVLVDVSWQSLPGKDGAQLSIDAPASIGNEQRTFLVGADSDRDAINKLADDLREAGIRVDGIRSSVPGDVDVGDLFVLVLSPNSIRTPLVEELPTQSLERRGVDVIPAVIEDCAVPARIAARLPVDSTMRVDGLVRRLQTNAMIDLDILGPERFEQLLSDLLFRLDFKRDSRIPGQIADRGIDFVATFQDAEGFGIPTQYLIQAKFGRSSYRDVAQLVSLVRDAGPAWRGMIVTNGRLTSVTGRQLERAQAEGIEVQVIDGPRLRALLLNHSDLIAEYFVRRRSR